jgi:signal transduction histidine kinase
MSRVAVGIRKSDSPGSVPDRPAIRRSGAEPAVAAPLLAPFERSGEAFLLSRADGRVGAGPSWVSADADRALQVFDSLIGNPLEFTPAGGTVTIGVERIEGEVVFAVEDSGPGIARMLVEAHAGRVWAESAPGAGTTVRFALPACGPVR